MMHAHLPVELDMDDVLVPMTKERALALQRELRDRFSQVTFQAALRSCENTFAYGSPMWKQIRQRLALKEQVEVIPKYGFPPTLDGVVAMVRTVQDLGDPQVDENSRIIEGLLWKTCIRESRAFDWTRWTEMRANTSAHRAVLRPSSPKTRHATDQRYTSASNPVPSSVRPVPPSEINMDEIVVPMTRERALALQSVLYGKFSDPSFVAQVNALAARNVPGSLMFRKALQELAFSVQAEVLPQWGFEASAKGVADMCLSIAALQEAEVDAKTLAINHLLSRSGTLHVPRGAF
uniref:Protein C10 n=1 Tax=Noctiluca scintillans TaxID=2966 RepID=A0A7S1A3S7_NOCSC|mmetsp:Transcript_29944/g.79816  ORF Transcript_29944/g.79816 Transcript_29944/m.79816 type:complete len:292 (+) Transcript_29944:20-895(+)